MDSTVLLNILTIIYYKNKFIKNNNKFNLRVIHINHGLHINSDKWVKHCKKECQIRNITFISIKIKFKIKKNINEELLRNARYKEIKNILKKDEILITAHHKNDQIETILLALKRGSGPLGLSGISENKLFYKNRILRPLLKFSKLELEEYAKYNKLNWIEDSSNNNLKFDRNFLRKKIIPILNERWPQFINTASRSALICLEQEKLLDELLENILNKVINPNGSLDLKQLNTISDFKRYAILRRWLAKNKIKMPSRKNLKKIWTEVALSKKSSQACLQINNKYIRKFRDNLYIFKRKILKIKNIKILPWCLKNKKIILPFELGSIIRYKIKNNILIYNNLKTKVIKNNYIVDNSENLILKTIVRAPYFDEIVSIRFNPTCGLLNIVGRNKRRKLKKILQELNIPPWDRCYIPMLFYNDNLISALGIFVTKEGEMQILKNNWKIFWLKK